MKKANSSSSYKKVKKLPTDRRENSEAEINIKLFPHL